MKGFLSASFFGPAAVAALAMLSMIAPVKSHAYDRLPSGEIEFEPSPSLQNIFLKLYPSYRIASDDACPLIEVAVENKTIVTFYSVSAEVPLVSLVVQETTAKNALAEKPQSAAEGNATITLTSSLLSAISNDAELAFVIAHEMNHLIHDLIPPPMPDIVLTAFQKAQIVKMHQKWELLADKLALQDLIRAGFSPQAGTSILTKIGSHNHSDKCNNFSCHPDVHQRIAEAKKTWQALSNESFHGSMT